MLDPLTALGLAGNVIQIVDFSAELAIALKEIHTSASRTTSENVSQEQLATNTKSSANRLISQLDSKTLSASESLLLENAKRCAKVCQDVLDIVKKMKSSGTFTGSLKATWYIIKDKSKKENLLRELEKHQNGLQVSLLEVLR